VSELTNSSATNGDDDGDTRYAIVAGSRRYHAAMEAGYETIPCKVIEPDDVDAAWKSLTENTDRRELSEQEIASQLQMIYELVRPLEEPENCPDCGKAINDETSLLRHCGQTVCELPDNPEQGPPRAEMKSKDRDEGSPPSILGRFTTDQQALEYIAQRFLGRTDENAIDIVEGHL